VPVIEKDVDGPNSLPLRMDGEVPNLGKFSACRRVARTIYLGSAPTTTAAHRGLEDRRVKLGCVDAGESPAIFRRCPAAPGRGGDVPLSGRPSLLYSTQPTVTKLADDRAEQLKRDPDQVVQELDQAPSSRSAQPGRLSAASIPCRSRGRTCPTTSTRAWSCYGSITPTARSQAPPPSRPPG